MRSLIRILAILLLLPGCAPRSADLTPPAAGPHERPDVLFSRRMGYDRHGLPKFGPFLKKRPERPGDQYAVVYFQGGLARKTYEIAVTGGTRPDPARPFQVLFEWTGKGFMVGASMLYGTGPVQFSYDARTSMVYTTASLAPVMVMTATGFVVGVVAGMVSIGEELRHAALRPQDVVLSATLYEYDEKNRLTRLRMFLSDEHTEVVRTEYRYDNDERTPAKVESKSYPEDRVRRVGE